MVHLLSAHWNLNETHVQSKSLESYWELTGFFQSFLKHLMVFNVRWSCHGDGFVISLSKYGTQSCGKLYMEAIVTPALDGVWCDHIHYEGW